MGLTQAELADKLDTSQQNVASWESGRSEPRKRNLARILEFFGPDSPVTRLAPTGRMEVPSVRRELFRPPSIEDEQRHIENLSAPHEPLPSLRDWLPEQYQAFVEPSISLGRRVARPDYWSPALGLEVVWLSHRVLSSNLLNRTRIAMQQLLVWSKAHPSSDRQLIVAVVAQGGASYLLGNVLERLAAESSLLAIEVVYTSGVEGVADTITRVESGLPVFDDETD